MRKRKPAATSGPSCQRCTAVLFAGLDRCGMCGWPSGVGYPPAEGELESTAAAAPQADEPASAEDNDHVGVQLDALAGMVARQGQPMAPQSFDETPEPPADVETAGNSEPAAEAPAMDADADDAVDTARETEPTEAETATEDVDPLTAPLAALTDDAISPEESQPSTDDSDTQPAVSDTNDVNIIDSDEEHDLSAESAGDTDQTSTAPSAAKPGRAAAVLRPASVLLVGTAVVNLAVVALASVLDASGSMTGVFLGLALVTLALWTGAAVTFLHWVSRAHSHVAATAASRQRHGASMSLVGWFIPIANFVIGYRVLQDLWTGSDPATRDDADAAPAKARMIDVWLLGIVTAALFGYVMPLALGDSALWAGVSGVGLLIAALGLVSTMGTISAWQSDEAAAEDSEGAAPPIVEQTLDAETPEPVATEAKSTAQEPVSASAE